MSKRYQDIIFRSPRSHHIHDVYHTSKLLEERENHFWSHWFVEQMSSFGAMLNRKSCHAYKPVLAHPAIRIFSLYHNDWIHKSSEQSLIKSGFITVWKLLGATQVLLYGNSIMEIQMQSLIPKVV